MGQQGFRTTIGGVAAVVVAALAWICFAPTALGGGVDYTVTTGTSMSPGIKAGDLAILRASDDYEVGDVIAYQSETLGRTVLHRIVQIEDGRFVTQGDANDWLDADRPTANDVRGRLWARIPGAGAALIRLRSPAALLALASVVALVAALARVHRRVRPASTRRRGPKPARRATPRPASPRSEAFGASLQELVLRVLPYRSQILLWSGLAAGIAVVVGMATLATPSSRSEPTQIPYEHHGTFSYSATAPQGPVYQDAELETGDTLFLKLVDEVEVAFEYEFEADATHDVQGTGQLVAELGDAQGWSRSIPITEPAELQDGRLELTSTLDMKAILGTIDSVQELTGVPSSSYTLNLVAEVDVDGKVAGTEVTDHFASPLTFELDDLRLRLVSAGDQLSPRQDGSVRGTAEAPATLGLLGLQVPVTSARLLALLVLVVAGTCLGVAAGMARPDDEDDVDVLMRRNPGLFVEVSRLPDPYGWSVDVDDLEVLVHLAEQADRVILHADNDTGQVFVLEDRGTTYVHRRIVPRLTQVPVTIATDPVLVPRTRTNGNGEVAADIDDHPFWS